MFYLRTSLLARELALVPTRVVKLSTTTCLRSDRNRPKKSGDKGPEKNYMKKMIKKANKEDGDTIRTARSLVEKLKVYDRDRENQLTEAVDKDSMRDLLSDMNFRVHNFARLKMQQKEIDKELEEDGDREKHYKAIQTMRPINFTSPGSGMKLNVFHPLDSDAKRMPPGKPNLTEITKQKQLDELRMLENTSHFEDLINGTGVPYPRQFPIDNESYETDESEVSFKDHVLLNNLIKDFPARGPVRHFMELVVTGLSMNPDYSVKEKRDIIEWYRDYFVQFTPEELQTLSYQSST